MADAVVPRLTQLLAPVVAATGHDLEGLRSALPAAAASCAWSSTATAA